MAANHREHVATPAGRVVHDAVVAGDTGKAYTECRMILPVGWQQIDNDGVRTTCKRCLSALTRRTA